MKLLLVIHSLADIEPFMQQHGVQPVPHATLPFISTAKILHHEVHLLVTGIGLHQTTYKVTKAISATKYHLALKVGFGNAYKEEHGPGTVLNIVNEKPGDMGTTLNNEWQDLYDLNLVNREDPPHTRGGHINLTNAYMNVFLPYKKAVGLTVNHFANVSQLQLRQHKYKADCETGDGLGLAYACLFEKQLFYHLCVIKTNLATGAKNFNLAQQILNQTLTGLIQKL